RGARHEPAGGAAEPAVGEERDALAQPRAHDRGRHAEHLAHAGPAARSLVADHDDVARTDPAGQHGGHGVLLALEHPRRPAMLPALVAGHLHHAAVGRDRALQDDEPAGGLDRPIEGPDHVLPRRLPPLPALPPPPPPRHPRTPPRAPAWAPPRRSPAPTSRRATPAVPPARPRPPAVYRPPGCKSAHSGVRRPIGSKSSMVSGTPVSRAMASRCRTALVEPPVAFTPAIAFSNAPRVTI